MFKLFKKKKEVTASQDQKTIDELFAIIDGYQKIFDSLKNSIERYKEVVKIQDETIKRYEELVVINEIRDQKKQERKSDGSEDEGTV